MIVLLTGGTGGAKLVQGLSLVVAPEELFVICNTADDFLVHGLHISPDLDTVTYTLAGISDPSKGWGIKEDTFAVLNELKKLGGEGWFQLGDRDLGVHILRSSLLREGLALSQITKRIRKALGIDVAVIPMSDDRVETRIVTEKGELSFQEYFVRDRWSADVSRIFFAGAERSRPAPGILEMISEASAMVLCPSNPVTSIGPILAVPGIRDALIKTPAKKIAVSPMIGGKPVSGPAHKFLKAMGVEVSAFGVANIYRDFLDTLLIATEDDGLNRRIEGLGIRPITTSIRMDSMHGKKRLARELLSLL